MKKRHLEIDTSSKTVGRAIHKPRLLFLIAVSCSLVLFVGCQNEQKASIDATTPLEVETDIELDADIDVEVDTDVEAEKEIETETELEVVSPSDVEEGNDEATILFSQLSKFQFVFASGAGAWQTLLNINEDGTFQGYYSDSDMGDIGEGYPNGIIYSSTFEGKFTTPKRVNDYTYSMSIESIKLEKEVKSEEIIDGIKYIYSEPYGINDAKEIYIYTRQAPIKELPEGFRSWVGYLNLDNVKEEYLPFYGLYNIEAENGFSSYLIDEIKEENTELDITAEISEIEKQYEELNHKLKNDDLNQLEMNLLAKDIYVLWDDEINKIWGYLKETLDKEAMDQLTIEQREWIVEKENEIEEAGSVYEGGSIQPMIEFLKGAELTRDRVYELMELLNKFKSEGYHIDR